MYLQYKEKSVNTGIGVTIIQGFRIKAKGTSTSHVYPVSVSK